VESEQEERGRGQGGNWVATKKVGLETLLFHGRPTCREVSGDDEKKKEEKNVAE